MQATHSHKSPPPTHSHNSQKPTPSNYSAKTPSLSRSKSVPRTTQTSRQLTPSRTPSHGGRLPPRTAQQAPPDNSMYTHTRHRELSRHHHTQSTNSSADNTPYHVSWNTNSSQSKPSTIDSSRSHHSSAHSSAQSQAETKERQHSKTSSHHPRFSNHLTTSSSSGSGLERSQSRSLGVSQDSNWVCPNCGGKGVSNTSISPGGTRTHVHTHKCVQVYTSPMDPHSTDRRDRDTQVDIADGTTGHAQKNSQEKLTRRGDRSSEPPSFTKQHPVATSTPTKFDGEEFNKVSGGKADGQFKIHRSTPSQPGQSSFMQSQIRDHPTRTGREECVSTSKQYEIQGLSDRPTGAKFNSDYSPYNNCRCPQSPGTSHTPATPAKSRQLKRPKKLNAPTRTMYDPLHNSPEAKTRPRNKVAYMSRSPVARENSGQDRMRKVVVIKSGSEKRKGSSKPESKRKVYLVREPYSESDSDSGPDIEVGIAVTVL